MPAAHHRSLVDAFDACRRRRQGWGYGDAHASRLLSMYAPHACTRPPPCQVLCIAESLEVCACAGARRGGGGIAGDLAANSSSRPRSSACAPGICRSPAAAALTRLTFASSSRSPRRGRTVYAQPFGLRVRWNDTKASRRSLLAGQQTRHVLSSLACRVSHGTATGEAICLGAARSAHTRQRGTANFTRRLPVHLRLIPACAKGEAKLRYRARY